MSAQDSLIRQAVCALLIGNRTRLPFTRADLLKPFGKLSRSEGDRVLGIISNILEKVYGIGLKKVGNKFMLVNPPSDAFEGFEVQPDTKLLIITLGVLMLSHYTMTEAHLKEVVMKSGIDLENADNQKQFKSYIKKQYIQKVVTPPTNKVSYTWGPRAHFEINKRALSDLISQVCDLKGYFNDPGVSKIFGLDEGSSPAPEEVPEEPTTSTNRKTLKGFRRKKSSN